MENPSRNKRYSPLSLAIKGIIIGLLGLLTLFGCADDNTTNVYEQTGTALSVLVNPASTVVVVTGPEGFSQTFTGNKLLIDLKPGVYEAKGTAPGFIDVTKSINVETGHTSNIDLNLQATTLISQGPRAVYRDSQGNLIPLTASNNAGGQYVFYAWLSDKPTGVDPAKLSVPVVTDPGKPLVAEQIETAPSFTQNLAGAWVGFKDAAGVVRPVIGADIRWEIDQQFAARVGSIQFGTSDDNRIASGYGVFDDQADTRTNNAGLAVENFPLIASEYPLYNETGIGTPAIDGFSWVTLFSPDTVASGRIVAVATINGEEIGKQILHKKFAAAPRLEITKTVAPAVVNLVAGTGTAEWTITVKNTGMGAATTVNLNDILASGLGDKYALALPLPAGSVANAATDGFANSFPLDAGATKELKFVANVTAPGTYCNEGQITSYTNGSSTWNPADLKARACFTALESNLSIVKDFVAADNTTSLGDKQTVAVNGKAKLRVRVINNGTGAASGVAVSDALTSGAPANYTLTSVGTPAVTVIGGGFNYSIGPLAAGATSTPLFFDVSASVDGEYCDTATVSATSGTIGIATDRACLTVSTPTLTILKTNAPATVLPGGSYTSTIVVTNTGTAVAKNVVVSDLLGLNTAGTVRTIYVSSSLNNLAGTLVNNTVTANTVDMAAGETLTFTVVSRIPLGALSSSYCNTATVISSNAATKEMRACVDVPAYSALQTQLIDLSDPIAVGGNTTYFSVLFVEALSNQGVSNNKLTYSFGLVSPPAPVIGNPGLFTVGSPIVYLDSAPVTNTTGLVVSNMTSPTAVLQHEGEDYTVTTELGKQVITMTPSVILQPNTALYVSQVATIPAGTPSGRLYNTGYIWESTGLVSLVPNLTTKSEPTTVTP